MIEIQFNININQVEQFFDNFRFDDNGQPLANDFPEWLSPAGNLINVYDWKTFYLNPTEQGLWKEKAQGPNRFQLVPCYVGDIVEPDWTDPQDPDPSNILTVIHYMREVFPGAIVVMEAFKPDGVRHGQTAVLDQDGNVISISGIATYPAMPKVLYLDYMPDVGDPPVPATDYADVCLTLGHKERIFE